MDDIVQQFIKEYHEAFTKIDFTQLEKLAKDIVDAGKNNNTFFIAGNGGSAATGSHLVTDILKTAGLIQPPVTINLSDNVPVITAISNDIDFENIFAYQLEMMGKENDVLLIITGSGNSPNLIKAISIAKNKNIKTWGVLGFDGGKAKDMLNEYILVPSYDYGIVEGIHSVLLHLLLRFMG